jgi:hypothetical protein
MTMQPDAHEIRKFVETYIAQARAATKNTRHPGVLQMILVHPHDDDVTSVYRYEVDDNHLAEHMTSDAINASTNGHNVYVEGRTVRRGLRGNQRGGHEDTLAVFALTVDSDADKGAAWTPTVPVSLAVETSPGNAHFWFFFEHALDRERGKMLGEQLRAITNADSDTGNICQPYRLAGTVNYPNKNKRERGRIVVATRGLGFNPKTLYTAESFCAEFPPAAQKKANGNGQATVGGPDETQIPAETMEAIRSTETGGRGLILWNIVRTLREDGWTIAGIVALLERYPDGIAKKFRGRLQREIERVWNKLGTANDLVSTEPVFDPWERYIVPEIPLHVLPPTVQDYVKSQAVVIGCDPSALAMAALTAFSGALDHRFAVKMMRNGNWWEHPRLWTLLVGDPSRKKTPIINDVTRPLERHQTDLRRSYEARLRDYEAAKKKDKDTDVEKPDPPVRYVVFDTTTEKLGEILSRSEHGLLVKRDEFSGWIGGMEKYSSGRAAGADRGFWLQAYDGGPHAVDRIGRGETYISNLSVSLIGGGSASQTDRVARADERRIVAAVLAGDGAVVDSRARL